MSASTPFDRHLNFFGSGCWVVGEDGRRVRLPQRAGIGVSGRRHERRDGVTDDRDVQGELDLSPGAELVGHLGERFTCVARRRCEGDRVGDLPGQRPRLRPANGHDHRGVGIGTV